MSVYLSVYSAVQSWILAASLQLNGKPTQNQRKDINVLSPATASNCLSTSLGSVVTSGSQPLTTGQETLTFPKQLARRSPTDI